MSRKFHLTLVVIIWVIFAIVTILFYSANHFFPHGSVYDTGDVVCQNDDQGPCGEAYKEDLRGLNLPGWVEFFKQSEGELLWMALLFVGIVISSKKDT